MNPMSQLAVVGVLNGETEKKAQVTFTTLVAKVLLIINLPPCHFYSV